MCVFCQAFYIFNLGLAYLTVFLWWDIYKTSHPSKAMIGVTINLSVIVVVLYISASRYSKKIKELQAIKNNIV